MASSRLIGTPSMYDGRTNRSACASSAALRLELHPAGQLNGMPEAGSIDRCRELLPLPGAGNDEARVRQLAHDLGPRRTRS